MERSLSKEEIRAILAADPIPTSPLMKKWKETYPLPGKPCAMGYGCIYCGNCPSGAYWKCPEEDREEYAEYDKRLSEWEKRHPNLIQTMLSQWELELDPTQFEGGANDV